jgi:hypothetical protein
MNKLLYNKKWGVLGMRGKVIEPLVLNFTQGLEPVHYSGFYYITMDGGWGGGGGGKEWGLKRSWFEIGPNCS